MHALSFLRLTRPVLVLVFMVLVVAGCRKKPAEPEVAQITDPLAYVPAQTSAYMQADLEALTSKTDLRAILNHETFQALMPDSAGYLKGALNLLLQGGLDRSRPAVFFQEKLSGQGDPLPWRMVAGLGNGDSLDAQLQRLGMPAAIKVESMHYTVGNGMTIAWDASVVAVMQSELAPESIAGRLFAVPDSAASTDAVLQAFLQKPGDMRLWVDAGSWDFPLPWLGGLLENSPGMRSGIRLVNEKGQMGFHVDVVGMSTEQQGRMDRWFAAAPGSKGWQRLPAGTPAWMSMALPADPADLGWMDEGLFRAFCASGTEAVLAFHKVKLPQFYPQVSLLLARRPGAESTVLENALRKEDLYKGSGRLEIMGLQARYGMNKEWITASTTDEPSSLFNSASPGISLPEEYAALFAASPIRAYVESSSLASVLPLPMIVTEVKDMALYAERLSGDQMAIHLQVRTADPEAYGLNTTAQMLMELIPAVQMMTSFL